MSVGVYALPSVCIMEMLCLCVNIMENSLSFNNHNDAYWLTDLLLHSRTAWVWVVSLLVICGWIKILLIQPEFSQPSLEVMRSQLWYNHHCNTLMCIDWKQWLFHNFQGDVMMSLHTHKQRNVMTLIIDFITSLSRGFTWVKYYTTGHAWVMDNFQVQNMFEKQQREQTTFLPGRSESGSDIDLVTEKRLNGASQWTRKLR